MKKFTVLLTLVLSALLAESVRAESLLQLWAHIVESNPTLKSSEYVIDQVRAQHDQVLANLLPNVSISGYYGYTSYNKSTNQNGFQLYANNLNYAGYRGYFQISQALFDLPHYLQMDGVNRQINQYEQQALAQRMQAAYDLVDQYMSVLEASNTITQLEAEQAANDAQVNRLRHMHERQMAKVTDLYEVEAYAHALQTAKLEAQHQKSISTEKLRALTGTLLHEPDPLIQDEFPEIKRGADEWVQESLSANPVLLSLKYAAESAQHMIASAQAQHLPTANVVASEVVTNQIYNGLPSGDNYTVGQLLFNVTIPLYSGGGTEAGVSVAVSQYQQAREKIEETRRSIEKDTRSAWFNAVSGRARIESSRQELGFREKAKIAQEKSYELGATTIVNVLNAHRMLLKANTDHFKARYDFIRSLIRLRLNAGSLADLDLEAIAPWFAGYRQQDKRPQHIEGIGE